MEMDSDSLLKNACMFLFFSAMMESLQFFIFSFFKGLLYSYLKQSAVTYGYSW